MSSADLLGLPPELGRYRLTGVLGRGGMGRVVRAHDPVLKRDVALKLVEMVSDDPDSLTELRFLFHREARATAQLKHPNIVEILDYSGPEAELPYIACELIDGVTLGSLLDGQGAQPAFVAAALAYEIASGLVHAHGRGIVHRDLKPDNVFWCEDGRVVLSDFGIAKAFDGEGRLGGTVQLSATSLYGSPSYMAPEQLTGEAAGPRSDLYALGTLVFELLVGRPAFEAADLETLLALVEKGERRPWPGDVGAPRRLLELVDRLLARQPERRPASAEIVARELRAVLDELGVSDPRLSLRGFGAEAPAPRASQSEPERPRASERQAPARSDPRQVRQAQRASELTAPLTPTASASPARATTAPRPSQREVSTEIIGSATSRRADKPSPAPIRRWMWVAVLPVLAAAITLAVIYLPQSSPPAPPDSPSPTLIPVTLRWRGPGPVTVDAQPVPFSTPETRLTLTPGRHVITAGDSVRREVLLMAGTAPVFDLGP